MLKVFNLILVLKLFVLDDKLYGSSFFIGSTKTRLCSSSRRQVIRVVDTLSEEVDRVLQNQGIRFFRPIPPAPPLNIPPLNIPPKITPGEANKKKPSETPPRLNTTAASLKKSNLVLQPPLDLPFIPPPPPEEFIKVKISPPPANQNAKTTSTSTASTAPKVEPKKTITFYEPDPDVSYFKIEDFKQLYSIYVAIDTEATGLGNGHTLTELAAVKIRNFQSTGEIFHTHLNPNREVSPVAERITGYNSHILRKAPLFRDVIASFSKFIGKHPLVFHNAHFDCKLINEGKKTTKSASDPPLSATNAIIDTQVLSNHMFPNKGNSLKNLAAKFKIDSLLQDQMHGALSDACQLIGVFRELVKKNKGKLYVKPHINWELLPPIDIYNEFEGVMQTDAELLFRKLGVICEIPKSFRYSHNMFDPVSGQNLPAVIFMLTSFDNEVTGYYVRFLETFDDSSARHKKIVFGTENNGMISLDDGDLSTIVIGNIPAALHVHGLLKHLSGTPDKIMELFRSTGPLTIKALANIAHLPTIKFHPLTKKVYILLHTSNVRLTDLERRVLVTLTEQHLHQQFFPIIQFATQIVNLVGYKVKYKQMDWIVDEDTLQNNNRILTLKKPFEPKVVLEIDCANKAITDSGVLVDAPNTSVLISNPSIEFKVVRIDKENFLDRKNTTQDYYSRLSARVMQQCSLNSQRDIQFIETCEEARNAYAMGQVITEKTPVKDYFMQRGIVSELPSEFRFLPSVYHPGIERYLPATLIPLFNENNIMVGVHRIFCGEKGERLAKQNKLPPKLSLGRTAGAAFEIYKHNTNPEVCFISEGFENGIVARDSLSYMMSSESNKQKLFEKYKIKSSFSIKSCVGINGLIDIPFEPTVHTVVMLADNDENNPDVKRTLNQTIRSFIKRGLIVYFALPDSTPTLKKPDLNDIYFQENKQNPESVAKVLLRASLINNTNVFTTESISIEEEIRRLSCSELKITPLPLSMRRAPHRPLQKIERNG